MRATPSRAAFTSARLSFVASGSLLPPGPFTPNSVKVPGVFARGSVMLGLDTGTETPAYMGTNIVDEAPTWIRRYAETNPLDATPFSQEQIANLKLAIRSKL